MRQFENSFSPAVYLAFVLALCFGCFIFLETEAAAAPFTYGDPVVSFERLKTCAAPGDLCTLQVVVNDAVDSLSCMDIAIAFDTSFVECVDAGEGALYEGAPYETFFRWKHMTSDTVDAVDCVLGYRSYILAPGRLVNVVLRVKRLGIGHVCLARARLWDLDRVELSPVLGPCAEVVGGSPLVTFEHPELVAEPGDLFRVNVLVEDPIDSLSCMDILVSFDTSLVELVDAQEGELYKLPPFETFFRWKLVTPDTVDAVDCVLGYRSYVVPPGELLRFFFRAKRLGEGQICFARARLWDIDRLELSPSLGPCAHVVIRTGTGNNPGNLPAASYLSSFPTPFNPSTRLVLYLVPDPSRASQSTVTVSIYAPGGDKVRSIFSGTAPAGRHEFVWDGRNDGGITVSSGVYFAVAETEGNRLVRKLVLLR